MVRETPKNAFVAAAAARRDSPNAPARGLVAFYDRLTSPGLDFRLGPIACSRVGVSLFTAATPE